MNRRLRYELLACAWHGHALDAARIRPSDELVVREHGDELRWHRCLRCDTWLPMRPPRQPARELCPGRADIVVPLRGKPLRDRFVLRLIALDRVLHFLVLGALAVGIFVFVRERGAHSEGYSRSGGRGQPGACGGWLADAGCR